MNTTSATSPQQSGAMLLIPSLLPTLQQTVNALHRTECARHGIDVSMQSAIVDSTYEGHIRIEAGRIPVIRVSAFWMLSCAVLHDTGSVAKAMAKAVCVADKKMRATLSRLSPMSAAEWIAERKTFRATNKAHAYALPEYSMSVSVSLTLTHGTESLTVQCNEKDIPETLRAARLRLTEQVYANEQASDLLDLAALAQENAQVAVACEVKAYEGNRTIETMEYLTPSIVSSPLASEASAQHRTKNYEENAVSTTKENGAKEEDSEENKTLSSYILPANHSMIEAAADALVQDLLRARGMNVATEEEMEGFNNE